MIQPSAKRRAWLGIGTATRAISLSTLLGVLLIGGALHAAQLVVVDVKPLAKAYRTSKIIGASVTNDGKEKVGSVDDLLISDPDRVLFAVLSVGGFLGIGNHLVVVPYTSLVFDDSKRTIVLPGASKDELKKLPEFHYAE
jgi:hypothetical protein